MLHSRMLSTLAVASLLLVGACSSATSPDASSYVRVRNASRFELSNVRIVTGDRSDLSEPTLAGGFTSPHHVVAAMHESVGVTLVVNGKALTAVPIEGFVPGFNAELAAGNYAIVIDIIVGTPCCGTSDATLSLLVSVVRE